MKSDKTLILAANQRLSRYLARSLHADKMPARELNIYPLEGWINECWAEAQDLAAPGADVALLSGDQEMFVWQEIADRNLPRHQLINAEAITDALADARSLLDGWNIPLGELEQYDMPETAFLHQCLAEFRTVLQTRAQVTREQALQLLTDYFSTGVLDCVATIYLYGFTDLPPQVRTLLSHAARRVETLPPPERVATVSLMATAAPNVKQELTAAAAWCREKLLQNPSGRIGVIVPGLESLRRQVEQVFLEQFDAAYFADPARTDTSAPFDISIGVPLTEVPIVGAALDLFGLLKNELTHQQVYTLLQSPFWGNGIDLARMRLLEDLNQWPQRKYRLASLREQYRELEGTPEDNLISASRCLLECATLARRHSGLRQLSAWIEPFKTFLKTTGWPGPRLLNSVEYQAAQQFFNSLDALPDYNNVVGAEFSFAGAAVQIRSLLKRKIFHPQTSQVPVQVMGLMEGAGMTFDYCWLLGMGSDNIPSAPRPNALIPIQLQKKYATPRCSAERELAYAKNLLADYRSCASEVVFSYSCTGDNDHPQISPLLRDIEHRDLETLQTNQSQILDYLHRCTLNKSYEFYLDESAPALRDNDFGGISHIKLHNTNPLYAFLHYRLGAEDIQEPALGMDPATRGILIHLVLARFWRETKTSDALQRINDLEPRLRNIIDTIFSTHDLSSLSEVEINQEKQRTFELVYDWLQWEAGRPAFSVIGIEQKKRFTLLNREMSVRLDRIDQLSTGEVLVVDYKTGSTNLNGLQKLPLQDPQLPVYALCMDNGVDAVAYAEINRKNNRLNGIGSLDGGQAGIVLPAQIKNEDAPDNWPELVAWWQADLESSLKEITAGHSPCITFNPAEAGYYSFLMPLTREQEQAADFE